MRTLILAAAAAALLASPTLAASKKKPAAAPAPAAAAAPAAAPAKASAKAKGTSKMAECAAQWKALGPSGQKKYDDEAKGKKSKKGNAVSGYNVWTGECMKKKA